MQSTATTVKQYLAELADDRRTTLEALRKVILKNLDKGYEEGMQYGHIGYYVPHKLFPAGYHCDPKQPLPFAALASQKNHLAIYMMGVYCGCVDHTTGETADARWFRDAWGKTGKKLDMGKSCVRFKKLDDVALDVVGEAIKRMPVKEFIKRYLDGLANKNANAGTKKPVAKKIAAKKPAAKSTKKKA